MELDRMGNMRRTDYCGTVKDERVGDTVVVAGWVQRRRDLGELSGENCAFVYITEEDSGEEPFAQIAADIEKHVKCPHLVCEDRAECIRRAILDHP